MITLATQNESVDVICSTFSFVNKTLTKIGSIAN